METFEITGTHIWYYCICPRETWLMAHHIVPDQNDDNVEYGKFMQEHVYQRDKKEVSIGGFKVDVVKKEGDKLIIGEIKKTSAAEESARMQLLFYLYELQKMGIEAEGELMFPEERKNVRVVLDEPSATQIEKMKRDIFRLVQQSVPPAAEKRKWCRRCAYAEMCWA